MPYPLGQTALSTLRWRTIHWQIDLFEVTRSDGAPPLRLSTTDREVYHQGSRFIPTAGERYDDSLGQQTEGGNTELAGAISSRTITPVDVLRGVYDDALVRQIRVDRRRPDRVYMEQWWYIDELKQDGRTWRASLSTSSRFFQVTRGEIYNQTCPAVLGDERCRAVPGVFTGTVTGVSDSQLDFTSTCAAADGRLRLGEVVWSGGNNLLAKNRILGNSLTGGRIQLAVPTRFRIRVGDTFAATEGCDGLATTCKAQFNNLANFRGNERQRNAKQLILNRGTVG